MGTLSRGKEEQWRWSNSEGTKETIFNGGKEISKWVVNDGCWGIERLKLLGSKRRVELNSRKGFLDF